MRGREGYPGPSFPHLPAGPQQRRYHPHTRTGGTGRSCQDVWCHYARVSPSHRDCRDGEILSGLPGPLLAGVLVTPGLQGRGDPVRTSGATTRGYPRHTGTAGKGRSCQDVRGHYARVSPSQRDMRDGEILSELPVPLHVQASPSQRDCRDGEILSELPVPLHAGIPITPGREGRGDPVRTSGATTRGHPRHTGTGGTGRSCQDVWCHYARVSPSHRDCRDGEILSGLPGPLLAGIPVTPGLQGRGDPVRTSGATTRGHPRHNGTGGTGRSYQNFRGHYARASPSQRDCRDGEILSELPVPLHAGIPITPGREGRGDPVRTSGATTRGYPRHTGTGGTGRSCQDVRCHYARVSPSQRDGRDDIHHHHPVQTLVVRYGSPCGSRRRTG
jgi:hypothetical protein